MSDTGSTHHGDKVALTDAIAAAVKEGAAGFLEAGEEADIVAAVLEALTLDAIGLEQVTTDMFRRHHGPLGVWQEADGRVYMGDPAADGEALYVLRSAT